MTLTNPLAKGITVLSPHERDILDSSDPYFGIKYALEPKRPDVGEIEVTFFTSCHLRCDFCFHDKDSTVGMSEAEIMAKLELVEAFFAKRQGTVSFMQLNMVGGELFQDSILDEYLPLYAEFTRRAKALSDKYGFAHFRIVYVSAFVFKRSDAVREFIVGLLDEGIDAHLICSYDVTGRPVNSQYARNVYELKPYIISINMVATVSTIKQLLDGGDAFFDQLYQDFTVYVDDYIPDVGHDDEMPSDTQLAYFMQHMLDNYPEAYPYADMLDSGPKPLHCLSLNKLTIFPDGSTANCLWNRYTERDFRGGLNRHDNAARMQEHLQENHCLSCSYYQQCGLRCFVQSTWAGRVRDLEYCPMKLCFEYLDGKPSQVLDRDTVLSSLYARGTSAFVRKKQLSKPVLIAKG